MQLLELRPWTVAHLDGAHTLYPTELSTVTSCTSVMSSCHDKVHASFTSTWWTILAVSELAQWRTTQSTWLQLFLICGFFLSHSVRYFSIGPSSTLCLTLFDMIVSRSGHFNYTSMLMLRAHACACALAAILCQSPPQPYQGQGRVLCHNMVWSDHTSQTNWILRVKNDWAQYGLPSVSVH